MTLQTQYLCTQYGETGVDTHTSRKPKAVSLPLGQTATSEDQNPTCDLDVDIENNNPAAPHETEVGGKDD